LHHTARGELSPHIDQSGLHVISRIAHRRRTVCEPGVFQALQCRVQELANYRLRLAALGHLRRGWSGAGLVAFVLSGCSGAANSRGSRQANAEKKDLSIHHSLPASTY
jgi:hypothetical protein